MIPDKHAEIAKVMCEHAVWVIKNTPKHRQWFNKAKKCQRRKERSERKIFPAMVAIRSMMTASQIAAIQMQSIPKFQKGSI